MPAVPAQAGRGAGPGRGGHIALPQMYEGDTRITNAADSNCVSIMAGTSDQVRDHVRHQAGRGTCPPTMRMRRRCQGR